MKKYKTEYKEVYLEEIVDILDNMRIPISADKREKGDIPYYGANGIQGYVNKYIFDEDLVLLAEDGGNFGSKTRAIAYKISGKSWVNNHAHVLRAKKDKIMTEFLCYSLMFYDVSRVINGTTRKKLNQASMKKIRLSVPELEIQEKIVKRLETLNFIINKRNQQLSRLELLKKSEFTQFFKEEKFEKKLLKDISKKLFAGGDKSKEFSQIKTSDYFYPVYSNGEKNEGLLCYSKYYKISEEAITISARGTIGFVKKRKPNFTPVVRLITILPKEIINITYLEYFLKKVDFMKRGTSTSQLTVPDVEKIIIPVPPIELQNKFAERIVQIDKCLFEKYGMVG